MLLQLLTARRGNASIFQLQTCANYFRSASGSLQRFHDLILMICTKCLQSDFQFYSGITVCAYKLVMIQLDNISRFSAIIEATRTSSPGLSGIRTDTVKILSRWIKPCCTTEDMVITSIFPPLKMDTTFFILEIKMTKRSHCQKS